VSSDRCGNTIHVEVAQKQDKEDTRGELELGEAGLVAMKTTPRQNRWPHGAAIFARPSDSACS
jgi:hypothetical protein